MGGGGVSPLAQGSPHFSLGSEDSHDPRICQLVIEPWFPLDLPMLEMQTINKLGLCEHGDSVNVRTVPHGIPRGDCCAVSVDK